MLSRGTPSQYLSPARPNSQSCRQLEASSSMRTAGIGRFSPSERCLRILRRIRSQPRACRNHFPALVKVPDPIAFLIPPPSPRSVATMTRCRPQRSSSRPLRFRFRTSPGADHVRRRLFVHRQMPTYAAPCARCLEDGGHAVHEDICGVSRTQK